jgi:ribosomal protein S11
MNTLIIIHIVLVKNNYFLNISNNNKILFIKTAGLLGFYNINKRGLDVLKKLIQSGFDFLASSSLANESLFLKVEGFKKYSLKTLLKEYRFIKKRFNFIAIKIVNKIPHNGCRKKKKKI